MATAQARPGKKAEAASRAKTKAGKSVAGYAVGKQENAPRNAAETAAAERHRMIAEAAYYRALRRGFHGGSDLEDWLEAEAEIDKMLLRG
ncbi:MAG: DUF2934 domain-containing protein [Burkholderiales bacterium]